MANELKITNGQDNVVQRPQMRLAEGHVNFSPGSVNNTVVFGHNMQLKNASIIIIGSGNKIVLGKDTIFAGVLYMKGDNQTIEIGDYTTVVGARLLAEEGCDITIGRHCMFSREIEIRTSDAHSVIDVETRRRVNKGRSVSIGDHVWVGMRALFTKGAGIGNDSIVGANAMVTKHFPESNIIVAGSPATVLRQGVTWNRKQQDEFAESDLWHWKSL